MYTRAMKREPELPYYVLMSDINYLSGSSNFVTSYRSQDRSFLETGVSLPRDIDFYHIDR